MRSNGIKIIIMISLLIGGFILAVIIFFYGLGRHPAIPEKSESEIEEELNQMVVMHLENKYGERFIIVKPRYGPAWHTTTQGSPIPGGSVSGESGFPRYCIAYAESDMDFKFRVYVYRESLEKSLDINNVKEIRDSYSWKFLREKIREYFDTRMAEMIPDERKWIISTVEGLRFGDSINKDSSLEQFLSEYNEGKKIDLWINLIVNGNSEDAVLEEDLYSITKEFYGKYDGKVNIYSLCFKAEAVEDFINLEEKKEENLHFLKSKEFGSWREKLKFLFSIKDFQNK